MQMIDNTFAFLDDFCLQQRHQLKRRYFDHKVVPGSGYDDPRFRAAYTTIQYVPEQDRYLMWANFVHVFADLKKQSEHCLLALAESHDGLHYQPAKGTVDGFAPVDNVVFAGLGSSIHGATVLYDPRDPDPARRFKCATSLDEPGRPMAFAPSVIAFSPDGSHWTVDPDKHVFHKLWSDAYNCLIWNPVLQSYQVFCRATGTDRRIATVISKDLQNWSTPRVIIHPDGQDAPGTEFYSMPVFYHKGIFYGYLWHFETDDEDPVAYKMAGRIHCELTYSYDGLSWNRTRHNPLPFNDYSGDGYGAFDNCLYNTILNREGDKWLTVASLSRYGHADGLTPFPNGGNHMPLPKTSTPDNIRRVICEMTPGRLCGLESIGLTGRLRTKNFLLATDGPLPSVNVSCPYGEIRVQLCDTRNHPVPGFTFDECVPFRGDTTAWTPQWQNRSLDEARGHLCNLLVELHDGCIFGISGAMMPHHSCLPQYGYGDVRTAAMELWGTMDRAPDYDAMEMR